jgi:TRAP-type C4-dicarboxylate transport system permease small subunit
MNQYHSPSKATTPSVVAVGVRWVDTAIEVASAAISIGALVIMFVSLMAEVVVRYLTNQGMGWPTEMPNILFPWLVMAGVVLGAQRGKHIAVNAINVLLNKTGNRILILAQQTLAAFTFLYLAYIGLTVIEITGSEMYPVTGITAKWAYLAMIVGFSGLGLTAITTFIQALTASDPLKIRSQDNDEEDV